MADEETTEETTTEPEGGGDSRLDKIEDKVDNLAEKLEKLLGGLHDKAQAHEQEKLDRPSTAADQAEARRQEMRDVITEHEQQKKSDSTLRRLESKVQEVEKVIKEKAPRQFRKVEQIMGWPDRNE